MKNEDQTVSAQINLPEILNLGTAEDLREEFLQHLMSDSDLTVDAQQVSTITTPCLQVVIAAALSLEQAGHQLLITNPSDAFKAAFDDLGFSDNFEKWSN